MTIEFIADPEPAPQFFNVGTFFEERGKVAVGCFYYPDQAVVKILRGHHVAEAADTNGATVVWRSPEVLTAPRRAHVEREVAKFHAALQRVRFCEG
ncbi:hypothetical protein AB0B28_17525 [Glycomyces sp. NPDC046736]|uniref:hypothetical protein n=1 Tax=Glycomyces sp. NPDC046736 TaxID=3155615 RepID=UPI0034076EDC